MINKILNYIRSWSPETQRRVSAGGLVACAIVLIVVWIATFDSSGINTSSQTDGESQNLNTQYITIEGAKEENGKRQVYFKVVNDTQDILNFPALDQIRASAGKDTVSPETILDRQLQPFAKKILSKTTVYGVLVFPDFNEKSGTMTFDDMHFEQHPETYFKEVKEVDYKQLPPTEELRS